MSLLHTQYETTSMLKVIVTPPFPQPAKGHMCVRIVVKIKIETFFQLSLSWSLRLLLGPCTEVRLA